jgi:predicted dehydrogenase
MKVGIVGAGGIASYHLKGYRKLDDVELVALCDIDQRRLDKLGEEFGIKKRFSDYRKMLRSAKLDAVSVCTPNRFHKEISMAFLKAGVNVLCEKPMAMNAVEAGQMLEAKIKSGKILMIAHHMRFRDDVNFLKNAIERGELGNIYHIRTAWLRRNGIPGFGSWFTTKSLAGGGVLIDIGVHALDLCMYLLGFPEVVSVAGSVGAYFSDKKEGMGGWGVAVPGGKCDVDDYTAALIKFAQGTTLYLELTWASHIKEDKLELTIMGTDGGASLKPFEIFSNRHGYPTDSGIMIKDNDVYSAETAHFIDCVKKNTPPIPKAEDGVKVMRIIDAIYQSSKEQKEVRL